MTNLIKLGAMFDSISMIGPLSKRKIFQCCSYSFLLGGVRVLDQQFGGALETREILLSYWHQLKEYIIVAPIGAHRIELNKFLFSESLELCSCFVESQTRLNFRIMNENVMSH